MKKSRKKTSRKATRKPAARKPAKKAAKKAVPRKAKAPGFFASGARATKGTRRQFHVLLDDGEREKLVKLSHGRKLNAAAVVRALINEAKK